MAARLALSVVNADFFGVLSSNAAKAILAPAVATSAGQVQSKLTTSQSCALPSELGFIAAHKDYGFAQVPSPHKICSKTSHFIESVIRASGTSKELSDEAKQHMLMLEDKPRFQQIMDLW